MREFEYVTLKDKKWDSEILEYVANIREYKGRQELYVKNDPAKAEKLIEIAKIQSTESSNAIEGIRTTDTRFRQIILDKTTPKNRDEQEIVGYRDVLNVIHESYEYINVSRDYILSLHKMLFALSSRSIGGKFKDVQNYISSIDENGKSYTLFTPLAPFETAEAVERICLEYNKAIASGVEPLILIPIFIHDFLCIHPFLDGNGRMSRLLTTLLLYKSGYNVGKYISLESKIAKHKDAYYDALELSQEGWHEAKEDNLYFVKYMLGIILSAYRDAEDRLSLITSKASSYDIVKSAVSNRIGKFAKADILNEYPTIGTKAVETALKRLCDEGIISKYGNGKATFYVKK